MKFENTIATLRENGIVAIPVFENKVNNCGWKNRNEFTEAEWGRAIDIAIRTGQLIDDENYSILCIDIDTKDEEIVAMFTRTLIENNWQNNQYYFEESVHGYHYIILVEGNEFTSQKLWWQDNDKCLIETKAGVAYVRVAPTEGFRKLSGKNLEDLTEAWEADEVRKLLSLLVKEKPVTTVKPHSTSYTCHTEFTDSPADDMRQNPWKVVAALQHNGWSILKEDGNRWYLQRPGATGTDNHSVTIAKEGGAVTVWSSMLNSSQSETVSPMTFLSNEFYHGDDRALASEWRVNTMNYIPPVSLTEEEKAMIERITENMKKKNEMTKKMDKEGFSLTAENVMSENVSVTDVIAWGEKNYKPWQFNESLFKGRSMFEDALRFTKANNYPQTHGMFLASLAATSACCARFVVGNEGSHTVHPAVYAGLALETGGGKNQCFEFVDSVQRVIKNLCRPYSRTIKDIEQFDNMPNPLDINFGSLRDDIVRCLTPKEGEAEDTEHIVHLRFFDEVGFADRLPATSQGFISSECVCGSTFYAQDEFGDFAKARGGDKQAICSIVKELFTCQDRTFSEAVTKMGINENNIRRVESPYLNLFFAFAPDSGVEGWLKRSTQDGFTGRLSIGCGVKKTYHSFGNCWDVDCVEHSRSKGLSKETFEWIKSYLHGVQQYNFSNYQVQTSSKTKKKVVYEILPPVFPRRFEIRFSKDAMRRIRGIQLWLEDKDSNMQLNETYRFILSRKTQNLSTYALLSFLSKRSFDFGIHGEEVGVDDVMWAFNVLLHELVCLPHIIHADLANASDADVEDVEEDRKMEQYEYQVYKYIVAHQGITVNELKKAKSTSEFPLPPTRKREMVVKKMIDTNQLRIIPNTVNNRDRQEIFLLNGDD